MNELRGKKVAMLATHGFEQSELLEPRRVLQEAGAQVDVVSPESGRIRGWNHTDWGEEVAVDVELSAAQPYEYDALVLPGGVINPDKLRVDEGAVDFVRQFAQSGKTVAAICHGPWTLVDAGVVASYRMTSYPSLKSDLRNAGADWVDEEVVIDDNLITSRDPGDLPAFCTALVHKLEEGAVH